MHNKSWLTTLPLWCELHWLPCATYSEIRRTFKQEIHFHDDYLILSHYIPFMQMLSNQYIFPTKFFRHIINTATVRVLQKFHHHYHGDCRILANGMQIHHLECHCHFTTILGRRPWSNYPWHCLRMCLHHLLLDTYQSHTMPTILRCFIWMLCYCTKHSIHPTVIISRWGLREWFWHCWPIHSFKENPSHTPCV